MQRSPDLNYETISVPSLNSNENAGSENKERGGCRESGLQDEKSLRHRLTQAFGDEAKLHVAGIQQHKGDELRWQVLGLKDVVNAL